MHPNAEYRRSEYPKQSRQRSRADWRIFCFPVSWVTTGSRKTDMKGSSGKPRTKKAKVLSSRTIYKGAVFGIRRDEVIEPSGVRTIREVITHPGSVVVLPVLPDGRILLIRQYRHATRQYLW